MAKEPANSKSSESDCCPKPDLLKIEERLGSRPEEILREEEAGAGAAEVKRSILQKFFLLLIGTVTPIYLGILGIQLGLTERPHNLGLLSGGIVFIAFGLSLFLSIIGVIPERRPRR